MNTQIAGYISFTRTDERWIASINFPDGKYEVCSTVIIAAYNSQLYKMFVDFATAVVQNFLDETGFSSQGYFIDK